MAQCFSCHEEIGYGAMMRGCIAHAKRNLIRRHLPVFDCPHCGVVCQEYAWSYYAYICLFMTAVIVTAHAHRMDPGTHEPWRFAVSFLAYFLVGNYFWWKWVARLKEPFLFWGH